MYQQYNKEGASPEIVEPEVKSKCPLTQEGMAFRPCQELLRSLLRSPRLAPLLWPLHKKMPQMSISCMRCNAVGYRSYFEMGQPAKIRLCCDKLSSAEEVEEVLTHELIHAYDYIVRGVDMKSGEEMACSEVRAAAFAECRNKPGYFWEYFKKSCVRGVAIRATKLNDENAEELVSKVFAKCYDDKMPFVNIYDPTTKGG